MASPISKHELEHLAELVRIALNPKEEGKLLKDLGAILDYFKELQELDTSNVPPMTGGTDLRDVLRADAERENTNQGFGIEAFPGSQNGYLKIPPVFE